MKIVINSTNEVRDLPLNKAMRLINKGRAHPLKETVSAKKRSRKFFKREPEEETINEIETTERQEPSSEEIPEW